jgi:type IV pilus assembly protein PilC
MPFYQYNAVRKDGSRYQGTREAADRITLFSELRKEGESILSVTELHAGFSLGTILSYLGSVKQAEKISFVRNLSAMIQAGLPLSRALSILSRQTRNKKFKTIINALEEEIKKGSPFHSALKKFPNVFSPLLISMVHAGEETGGLAQALAVVGTQMERMYALGKRVKGALIYPAIVITVMIGIAILMMLYVVPTLASTFTELKVELPASTRLILATSDFLVQHTIAAIGLIIGVIFKQFFN